MAAKPTEPGTATEFAREYKSGESARHRGETADANPHESGSDEWAWWIVGFEGAEFTRASLVVAEPEPVEWQLGLF